MEACTVGYPLSQIELRKQTLDALANLKPGKNIIIIDFINADKELMEKIQSPEVAAGFEKKLVCLYPKICGDSIYPDLPFSRQFLMNLCHRFLVRQGHIITFDDPVTRYQVFITILKPYTGFKDVPSKVKAEMHFDHFEPIEFYQGVPEDQQAVELSPIIDNVHKQISVCRDTYDAAPGNPFAHGRDEYQKLYELLTILDKDAESPEIKPYLSFGRKDEWNKSYEKIKAYIY